MNSYSWKRTARAGGRPRLTHTEFDRTLQNPEPHLPYDYFASEEHGAARLSFPYTLALLRTLANERVDTYAKAYVAGTPADYPCWEPSHPAHAISLAAAILTQFCDDVLKDGRRPLVLILPTGRIFQYYVQHHTWMYWALIEALTRHNIPMIDFGHEAVTRLPGVEVCSLFGDGCASHYHFDKNGYELLADTVQQYLNEHANPH